MKLFLLIIAIIPAILCSCTQNSLLIPTTVAITTIQNGTKHSCYGVILDKNYILTVAHIFDDSYSQNNICMVSDIDKKSYLCRVVYIDFDYDLALIDYENDNKSINLSENKSSIYVKNFEIFEKCTDNTFVTKEDGDKSTVLLQLKLPLQKGSSGSAVFSKNGLVGIICGISENGKTSYAVPSQTVNIFLSDFFQNNTK